MHRDSSFSSVYHGGSTSNYRSTNRAYDLELRLQDLASRREVLEKRTKEKQQLLDGFSTARKESLTRLVSGFEEQNEQARQRNLQLLQDVVVTIHQSSRKTAAVLSSDFSDNNNTLSNNTTKSQLLAAKKSYLKTLEDALPLAHRQEAIRLEEKMKTIKMEKIQSMQRREKLRQELEREERVRYELETQRQELVQTLALEQSDLLRAKASSLLIAEEGKLADKEAVEHIARMGQQLSASIEQRLIEKQQAGIYPHFVSDTATTAIPTASYSSTDAFRNDYNSRKSDIPIVSRDAPMDIKPVLSKKQVHYETGVLTSVRPLPDPTVSTSHVDIKKQGYEDTSTVPFTVNYDVQDITTPNDLSNISNAKKNNLVNSDKSSAMLPSPALHSSTEVRSFADYYEQQHYSHSHHSDDEEEEKENNYDEEEFKLAKDNHSDHIAPVTVSSTPPLIPQRSQKEIIQPSNVPQESTNIVNTSNIEEQKSSPRYNNNPYIDKIDDAESTTLVVTSKLANIERFARSNWEQNEDEVDGFDDSGEPITTTNKNYNSRMLEDSDEFGINSSGIRNNINNATTNNNSNNNSNISSPPSKPPRKPSITQEDFNISNSIVNNKNSNDNIHDSMLPNMQKIPIEHVVKILFPSPNSSISKEENKPYLLSIIRQQYHDQEVQDLQGIYNDNIFPLESILKGVLSTKIIASIKQATYLIQLLLQAHGLPSYASDNNSVTSENMDNLSCRFSSEVYGNAVLLLLAYHGASLVPKDCVTGVVTLEKLKKELKKMPQQGGLQALVWWEELVKHAQELVHCTPSSSFNYNSKKPSAKPPKNQAFNSYIHNEEEDEDEFNNHSNVNTDPSVHTSMNADYLAKVFTRALVDYVHPSALTVLLKCDSTTRDQSNAKDLPPSSWEDFERMKRKIDHVLQLALLSSPASAAANPLRFSNESLPSPPRNQPSSVFSPEKSFSQVNNHHVAEQNKSTIQNSHAQSDKPIVSSSVEKGRQGTTKPFWMDDDEIASDEEWEKPPVVKDLDAELNAKSDHPTNKSYSKHTAAPRRAPQEEEDVFDF